MTAVGPDFGFGLYVHWPYCARICPYCDFNVYAAKDRDRQPLLDAIVQDILAHKDHLPKHPALNSVFLGGGTPSLLKPSEIARILETANTAFGFSQTIEITLEANPNDVLVNRPDEWMTAGINRLSIGVQSLEDEALTFLGRDHDSANAYAAVERAKSAFDNISIDMIYARPGQSEADWELELRSALALGAPHLSLYELTIEERTAFGQRAARGDLTPMPDDDQADLYEVTQSVCDAHGLSAYEVSNHARDLKYESGHNHIYWASGDWIGVGPGAHGRLTKNGERIATEAARRPSDYIAGQACVSQTLNSEHIAREFLAMSLRPITGLDLARYRRLFGQDPDPETVSQLIKNELVVVNGDRMRLTLQGRLIADHITNLIVPY